MIVLPDHHCPFTCCSWRFPRTQIRQLCEKRELFSTEDIDFQEKIAYRTGLGDDTAVCPAIQSGEASKLGIEAARFEFGATCFTTIQDLLNKTGIRPKDIDIVITNSSLFNPTPSLSAAILNHFKMSSKTINYSLGGMGCSAGVASLVDPALFPRALSIKLGYCALIQRLHALKCISLTYGKLAQPMPSPSSQH